MSDYNNAGYEDVDINFDNNNITWLYSEGKTIEWLKNNGHTFLNIITEIYSDNNIPYADLLSLGCPFGSIIEGFYKNDNINYNGKYNKSRIDISRTTAIADSIKNYAYILLV